MALVDGRRPHRRRRICCVRGDASVGRARQVSPLRGGVGRDIYVARRSAASVRVVPGRVCDGASVRRARQVSPLRGGVGRDIHVARCAAASVRVAPGRVCDGASVRRARQVPPLRGGVGRDIHVARCAAASVWGASVVVRRPGETSLAPTRRDRARHSCRPVCGRVRAARQIHRSSKWSMKSCMPALMRSFLSRSFSGSVSSVAKSSSRWYSSKA